MFHLDNTEDDVDNSDLNKELPDDEEIDIDSESDLFDDDESNDSEESNDDETSDKSLGDEPE